MGIFLFSLAMAASATPPAPTQTTPTPRAGDDRVVCRRDDLVGTRLAPRVCMTRAQWRQRETEARTSARGLIEDVNRGGAVAHPTID